MGRDYFLELQSSKYINTYHSKMKPSDIKSSNKDPKFKIVNIVRMSKYKNIFVKGCMHSKLVRRSFYD